MKMKSKCYSFLLPLAKKENMNRFFRLSISEMKTELRDMANKHLETSTTEAECTAMAKVLQQINNLGSHAEAVRYVYNAILAFEGQKVL